jgi:hypothetical protein
MFCACVLAMTVFTRFCMFVQFSRALPLRVPLFVAMGHFFASHHLTKYVRGPIHTGRAPPPPSLFQFFHNSGHESLLNDYARMLLGNHDGSLQFKQRKAMWIKKHAAQRVQVVSITPIHREGITLKHGEFLDDVTFSPRGENFGCHNSYCEGTHQQTGQRIFVSMRDVKNAGGEAAWHVEYEDSDTPAAPLEGGMDIASAAAMRACSSGLLSTLVRRLVTQSSYPGQVADTGRDVVANRAVLAVVGGGRLTSITKVKLANLPASLCRSCPAPHNSSPPPPHQMAAAVPLFHFVDRRYQPLLSPSIQSRPKWFQTPPDPTLGPRFGATG